MKTLTTLSLSALAAVSIAQTGGYAIHVDFYSGDTVQAALAKIGTARNVPILGDVDFSALFAMQSQTSLGIAATKGIPLGENLAVFGGLAIRSLQEEGKDKIRFRGGIVAGVSWRF